MKNYVQAGRILSLKISGTAVSSGEGHLFGDHLFGVAVHDVAKNGTGEFITEGVVKLEATAPAVVVGDRVKSDGTGVAKAADTDSAIGIAVTGNGSNKGPILVKLVPTTKAAVSQ